MSNNEALTIATAADTHGTVLHSLRKHEDVSVRAAVAKHANIYPETLRILSHDKNIDVLHAVANNLNAHRLHRTIAENAVNKLRDAGETLSA